MTHRFFLSIKTVVCFVVVEQSRTAGPLQCKQPKSKTLHSTTHQPAMAPTPIFMYSCVYQNWPAYAAVPPPPIAAAEALPSAEKETVIP